MAHKERIIANVESLSSLTETALTKIGNNILSISARKMMDILGVQSYSSYVTLQSNTDIVNEIEDEDWCFELSSDDGRKLKDLELAESYCALYYTHIALKKVDSDTVMTQIETWGEGSIRPVDVLKILEYGDKYIDEAKSICLPYRNESSPSDDETILSVGGVGFISI